MKIGIAGKMGTGKSTVAKMIAEKINGKIVPFAKPLKDLATQMGWNGVKDEKGRRLLQLLGTECGRECIGEDIWISHWLYEIHKRENNGYHIIADDVRFENELNVIRVHPNGILIKIKRLTNQQDSEHASERDLPDSLFDYVIINDGSIEQLEEKVWSILQKC